MIYRNDQNVTYTIVHGRLVELLIASSEFRYHAMKNVSRKRVIKRYLDYAYNGN